MARGKFRPYRPRPVVESPKIDDRDDFDCDDFDYPSKLELKQFDSIGSLLTGIKADGPELDQSWRDAHFNGLPWFNGESLEDSIRLAENGDDSLIRDAEKLLDKLESVDSREEIQQWQASPCGAYPVIPEFISGAPDCMRLKQPSGEVSPISIYVCTTSSAGIDAETMMKRGIAILALVLKLQQVRPVELYLTCEINVYGENSRATILRVDSKPLSLAHACYMLTSTGFSRRIMHAYSGHGQVPGRLIPIGENDLYVGSVHLDDEIVCRPIDWVNNQIKIFNKEGK